METRTNGAALATPSSPLSPLQFGRGGLVKKRFRRSNLGNARAAKENAENACREGGAASSMAAKKPVPAAADSSSAPVENVTAATGASWWDDKRDHFRHWLRCNPLRLGIGADSVAFIKEQLDRGDKNLNRRPTCWRHVVVELLSTGVPGLDPELLSVAEIPENTQGLDMAAVLNTLPSVVDGSNDMFSEEELKRASPELLRREVLRLASERSVLEQVLLSLREHKRLLQRCPPLKRIATR